MMPTLSHFAIRRRMRSHSRRKVNSAEATKERWEKASSVGGCFPLFRRCTDNGSQTAFPTCAGRHKVLARLSGWHASRLPVRVAAMVARREPMCRAATASGIIS
jgi:hypothetical protein